MTNAPVLLLGYNRPEQMAGLIKSLEGHKPELILLAVDGPRDTKQNDIELVKQTQETVSLITWNAQVLTRFRKSNMGLRRAVVDAVTWATTTYGNAIVLEDDVRVGPELLDYFNFNLDRFKAQERIAHINGYNLVPVECLSQPTEQSRLSIYPESYAWATWDRAWEKYDDELTWAKNASQKELKSIVGTTFGALKWKQNFSDASAERIDTWAYRWLASMWEHQWLMVSPNRNISTYEGNLSGTHTRRKPKWSELEAGQLPTRNSREVLILDKVADQWLSKNVFRAKPLGVLEGVAISTVLGMKRFKDEK
jgi:hypothetical protein